MGEEEDQQKYESHFAKYLEHGISADNVEEMYENAHKKIRETPDFVAKEKKSIKHLVKGNKVNDGKTEYTRNRKISKKAKFNRVQQKIASAQQRMLAEE